MARQVHVLRQKYLVHVLALSEMLHYGKEMVMFTLNEDHQNIR